ncbi:hypothetical protein [Streptomyces sp. NPDC050804]|uniref:hypothetical protein n=1 Tax=Streptomyces sp. NPDC050804 TaxID=3154745 RepID=UPI00341ACF5C
MCEPIRTRSGVAGVAGRVLGVLAGESSYRPEREMSYRPERGMPYGMSYAASYETRPGADGR